ncbi:uncharacterized protein BT62DRAFT_770917 [Guyanagaster necrorhizus]|uniref:DUF6534 domain-containing protein n=1 Tax=Guyanagaster necrorhizus TaxID=856835 RepID=A0A9P7VES8_9AGAR|nr:uncharacterized protein BT62DRAFT_770917 [Guyanagaster necrorhizus MCA 3950]KAG7439238.1 hypothetical protein BT62DRAFT_770917 [Guyanagaster necrorhizus MCA 3950]
MNSVAVIVPSLGMTIGAAYIGAMLSSLLFGITVLQVFIYYREYPDDWRLYRYSVGILWVLDALHLSLTIHAIYHYTVDSFGDYVTLGNVVWSFKLQILVNVVIIVFVQSLYAVRLWKFGRHFHRFLPWIVIFVVACGFAVGILLVYKTRYTITTFTGLASMMGHRRRLRRIHRDRLLHIVRNVLLPSQESFNFRVFEYELTAARIDVYITLPNTLVFLGVEFLLTKLYVNSLLSMLNARKRIQGKNTGSGAISSEPTSFSNVIRLTPTTGCVSAGDIKYDGFSIPLSEIRGSGPSQNQEDSSQIVGDKRSRVEFTIV